MKILFVFFITLLGIPVLAKEGLYAPHQIKLPFEAREAIGSTIRVRPLIGFDLHVFKTKDEAKEFRQNPAHLKKRFLTKGVMWQVIVDEGSVVSECASSQYILPGNKEICDTYALKCSSLPCHVETDGFMVASATGFLISNDGLILTNYHVARECIERLGRQNGSFKEEECPDVEVALPHFMENSLNPTYRLVGKVKILRNVSASQWAAGLDFALLKIDISQAPHLKLSLQPLQTYQSIWTLGFPAMTRRSPSALRKSDYIDAANDLRISSGRISELSTGVFFADNDGVHGSSGSPALDASGKVVGIVENIRGTTSREVEYAGEAVIGRISAAWELLHLEDFLTKEQP